MIEDLSGRTLGRFRLEELLGYGSVGAVYRATDLKIQGRTVALKLLRSDHPSIAERRELLRTDISALAKLNHPCITSLIDVHEEEGQLFFSMEYVDGETLADHLRTGPLPLHRAIAVGIQVAEALAHAHGHGLIHRDIKPGNIKVSREGYIKVMDFGLAALIPRDIDSTAPTVSESDTTLVGSVSDLRPAAVGRIVGTYAYMSPEQTKGWRLDQQSDVFAFGVVLYEVVTGERPFQGATPAELLHAIREQATPSIDAARFGLPAELITLIESCLQKNPASRPQGMTPVLEALRSLQGILVGPRARRSTRPIPLPAQEPPPPSDPFRVTFVGREAERTKVENHLEHAAAGEGSTLLIAGEAGAGKSRLVGWGLDRSASLGGLRILGRCVLRSGAPPFHPFVEAAGQLLDQAGLRTTVDLDRFLDETDCPPPLRPAIASLIGLSDQPDLSPDQILAGACQLFVSAAGARGAFLTVVIEDLQWADEATVDLFSFLAHRVPGTCLALVASYRTDRGEISTSPEEPPHLRLLDQLASRPDVETLELGRLTNEDVVELATAILPGIERDRRARELVVQASGGNPFFALEYLRELREQGNLVSGSGGYTLAEGFRAPIPRKIQEILERRLARLTPGDREVLEVAAVHGDFIDPGPIAVALELSRLQLLRAVRSLHGEHHLLVPVDDGFRFDHAQVREVLLQSLGLAERREIHLLLAEAVEQTYGLDEDHAAVIALHLAEGNQELDAVPHYLRAAAAATRAQALADADRYLDRALTYQARHAPGEPRRWEIGKKLVKIKQSVGDEAGAEDVLRRSIEQPPGPPDDGDRAWAQIALATSRDRLGDQGAAKRHLDEAARLLGDDPPDPLRVAWLLERSNVALREGEFGEALKLLEQAAERTEGGSRVAAEIRYKIGHVRFLEGDYPAATESFETACEWARSCGDLRQEAIALYSLAHLQHRRGHLAEARDLGEKAVDLAERVGIRRGLAHATNNLALILSALGERDEAIELHRKSLALKRELRDPHGESTSLHNLADLSYQSGALAEGLEYARRAVEMKRSVGEMATLPTVLIGYGSLLAECGRLADARNALQEAEQVAGEIAEPDWSVRASIALGKLACAEGHDAEAKAVFQKASDTALGLGLRIPTINAQHGLLRIAARGGQRERLGEIAETLDELLSGTDSPQARVLMHEAHGLVAWAEGRVKEAGRAFEKILDYARTERRVDFLRWVLRSLTAIADATGSECADEWRRELESVERRIAEQFENDSERRAFRETMVPYPAWVPGAAQS